MHVPSFISLPGVSEVLVSFPNLHNFNEFCARRISGTKTDYS